MKRFFTNKGLALALLVALTFGVVNCGALMHSERNGRKSKRIDPASQVLDCPWLLVWMVPAAAPGAPASATAGIDESGMAGGGLNVGSAQE